MLGISQPADVTLEYCCALIAEYTALDCAQVFTLLKKYGHIPDKQRFHIGRVMCKHQYAKKIAFEGRTYFVRHPRIKPTGRLMRQICCFWVLLDYLDRVDQHYASGTPSSLISMEIEGRDYSILYCERGKERMCSYSMERGGETKYFVVIEDINQIPLNQSGLFRLCSGGTGWRFNFWRRFYSGGAHYRTLFVWVFLQSAGLCPAAQWQRLRGQKRDCRRNADAHKFGQSRILFAAARRKYGTAPHDALSVLAGNPFA